MDYAYLENLRTHAAWKLLRAENAAFIISFFHFAFIKNNTATHSLGERTIVFSFTQSQGKLSGCYFLIDKQCPESCELCASSIYVFSGKQDQNGLIRAITITRDPADGATLMCQIMADGQISGLLESQHEQMRFLVHPVHPDRGLLGLYEDENGNPFRIERLCNGKYLYHEYNEHFENGYEYFDEGYLSSLNTIRWPDCFESLYSPRLFRKIKDFHGNGK